MAQNKILPWAQTGTANVLSDADYAADVASGGLYGDGVKTGQASSKQANKTWRQATAPGAGLGQFIVDNLGVDVTDADTPATFSTRIANAVLKLAQISPFNQSWATATGGYRKYAIVSDSSGNFWVSTADQNVTVPGANGAKWQSLFNGYATQDWVNTAFQPVGDYATNTALQAETQRATQSENNLQASKVNRAGDTMTGGLTIVGGAGYATDFSPPNPSQGSYINYPGYSSIGSSRGVSFGFCTQEHVGTETLGLFTLSGAAVGSPVYWYMHQSGRFGDSIGGNYAYTTEVPVFPGNLSGNGWQKIPSGLIIQWGQTSYNGTYSFPITFPNGCFCIVAGNTDAQGSYVDNAFAYAVNNSQFYIATKASNTGTITGFHAAWVAFGF